MDDKEIIELYWRRDEQAVAETDRKYGAYCRSVAMNILGVREDAEECTSDTYIRAWESIPPERPGQLRLWLAKVTRNLAIDRWRSRCSKKRSGMTVLLSELDECIPDEHSPEQLADAKELGRLINAWLAELDEGKRTLFMRRYWAAQNVAEIAKSSGVSPNALAQRLMRLRCDLKKYLEREGVII